MNIGATETKTRDGTIDGVPLPVGVTANTGVGIKSWVWTLAGSYRVQSSQDLEMDVFAGARLLWIQPLLTYNFNVDVGPFVGPCGWAAARSREQNWDADRRRQGPCRHRREPRMVHSVLPRHWHGRLGSHVAGARRHRVRLSPGARWSPRGGISITTSSRAPRSTISR